MPNLLNQSKHDESEPRLALQIRNQEQKRSKRGVEGEQNTFRNPVRKFAPGCEISHWCENSHWSEISHWCEFSQSAKFVPYEMSLSPFFLT